MMKKVLLVVIFFLVNWPIKANSLPFAITRTNQNLYAAPELIQDVVGYLNAGTTLTIEGRDETGIWLLVNTPDQQRGWAVTTLTKLENNINLHDLPVLTDVLSNNQSTPLSTPLSANPDTQATIERLLSTPIFYNFDTQAVHDIFQHGQTLGKRADVFTKVGDSNTTSGDFLYPMGLSNQCDLGPFNYLQDTISYFSVPVPQSDKNSFTHTSIAARKGLSSSAALDPMWAAGNGCAPNENPVACEYRRFQPSIAIIMVGLMDVRYNTAPDLFRSNIEQLIQMTINEGVIPVITNIIVIPEQQTLSFDVALRIDDILLDIADQYQIPMINLWRAVQPLPNYGIGPDRTHLRHVVGSFCDFTGAEQTIGGTLRNLLTLETLDELRRNVSVQ
jgi:hypothetical protein